MDEDTRSCAEFGISVAAAIRGQEIEVGHAARSRGKIAATSKARIESMHILLIASNSAMSVIRCGVELAAMQSRLAAATYLEYLPLEGPDLAPRMVLFALDVAQVCDGVLVELVEHSVFEHRNLHFLDSCKHTAAVLMSALALELADVEVELLALQDDAVSVAALAGARCNAGCNRQSVRCMRRDGASG